MSAPGGRRAWDGHVDSVREIIRELGGLRPADDDGRPVPLAAVLNLVVAGDPSGAADAERVIAALADHQPSRAIIIERDPDGDGIDAHVEANAQVVGASRMPSRVELLELRLHGATADGAASAVQALLRPDLPVFLWWPTTPALGDPVFRELCARSDRLICEADCHDGGSAIEAIAATIDVRGPAVTDLAWAALTPWRQLLHQLIDDDLFARLRAGGRITIRHHGTRPCLGSMLLAGWLLDSLGPSATVAFVSDARDDAPEVRAIRITSAAGDALDIERVTGRPAAVVATHDADGATRERMMPMPERTRPQLLAGELELQRRDAPFERAVGQARRILRAGVPDQLPR